MLTQPKDLKNSGIIKMLVYGQPGVGKTTLALSSPNPVLIDLDGGLSRVKAQHRVPSLQVKDYKQVLEFINSDEIEAFDTIVIDTLGKLVDRIGDYLAKENPKVKQSDGTLSMKGWGTVKLQFLTLFKTLESKNKSLIFVAHEREEKDGDSCKKRPDVAGSSGKEIIKELDLMGYMETRGNKRTISFTPSDQYYAKNSVELNGYIEVSDISKGNNFVKDTIIQSINKSIDDQNELLEKYEQLKTENEKMIESLKNKEEANNCLNEMQNIKVIWDSKFVAWNNLLEKAKSLNIEFNKQSKQFV